MLTDCPLGKTTSYVENYSPEQLYPISRTLGRDKLDLGETLPFHGVDIWNAYEISWLNAKGKPEVAFGEFSFPCISPFLIESKSFKLYLNSFNQSKFADIEEVCRTLKTDLSAAIGTEAAVTLHSIDHLREQPFAKPQGLCLDALDIETDTYECEANLLKVNETYVEEVLYSNLLKSNCLATGQPDWGTLYVKYAGEQINHESLLKYIISFRRHSGFHEDCVEKAFCDIMEHCKPERLTVYARYTRRGGLDINPFRSNFEEAPLNLRLERQ